MDPNEILRLANEAIRIYLGRGMGPDEARAHVEAKLPQVSGGEFKTFDEVLQAARSSAGAEASPEEAAVRELSGDGGNATTDFLYEAATALPGVDRIPAVARRTRALEQLAPQSAILAAKAAGYVPIASAMSAMGLGPVQGNALLAGADEALHSEGTPLERAGKTAAAMAGGAVLGKAGSMVARGGLPVAGALGGGLLGAAAAPGGLRERAEFGLFGAAGGYMGGRALADVGMKVLDAGARQLGRALPSSRLGRYDAVNKLLTAVGRDAIGPQDVQAAARSAVPGMTTMDLGPPGGNIEALARTAQSFPSAGAKRIANVLYSRSKLDEGPAIRSVRRALGNRYTPQQPVIAAARDRITQQTAPLYRELEGVEVSSAPLVKLIKDEPIAAEVWREAQRLAAKQVRDGVPGATPLPDLMPKPLHVPTMPGLINAAGQPITMLPPPATVPVVGLDYLKQALRTVVERSRNSQSPITRQEAKLISQRLSAVVAQAQQESAAYARALAGYGRAAEGQVQGLGRQVATKRGVLGGSPTARIQAGQMDFMGRNAEFAPNVHGFVSRLMSSQAALRARGFNESVVNELEPLLTRPVTADTPAWLAELEAVLARRQATQRRAGNLLSVPVTGAIFGQ